MQIPGAFPWNISVFPGGMISVNPQEGVVKSTTQLAKLFTSPPVRERSFNKKSLPCWSPAVYAQGVKRGNANVLSVSALVYDFDHTEERPEKISERLRERGVGFALHTTWSHSPTEPRYRVILFLSRSLTPNEYGQAWENGLRLIGYDAGVDRQARNISRHYALPAHKKGEEYLSDIYWEGAVLDTDKVTQSVGKKEEPKSKRTSLSKGTVITLDTGESVSVEDVINRGSGKYKCTCPFQKDASSGSAFLRITKDGRCFLQCTSERHTHDGVQFWLSVNKSKYSARSGKDREARLVELPTSLLDYAENRLGYNALQGVFFRHSEGSWQISTPLRKEALTDHLIGLLPKECDKNHASALVDHIISRQVYGFDCQFTRDKIVRRNEVPMLNLYAWPDLLPEPGAWGRIEQVLELLCDGDGAAKKWVLHWSAALIQHPDRRSMVAVLTLSTQQGVGKSMYGRLLAEIIGTKNSVVVSNKALRDNFNSHYVTSLLVLADEVGIERNAGDVVAEIKAAITDDRIHCSTPYAARQTVVNRMTWWLTSNKRLPFLVEKDDRRFTILSPGRADTAHRRMLRDCFDPRTSRPQPDFYEELQAFAHDLKQLDVDWDLISRPYRSSTKDELQFASMGSVDSYINQMLQIGPSRMLAQYPAGPNYMKVSDSAMAKAIPCETLYGSYREWCLKSGRTDIRSETLFRLGVKDISKVKVVSARVAGSKVAVYIGIPVLEKKEGKLIQMPS